MYTQMFRVFSVCTTGKGSRRSQFLFSSPHVKTYNYRNLNLKRTYKSEPENNATKDSTRLFPSEHKDPLLSNTQRERHLP